MGVHRGFEGGAVAEVVEGAEIVDGQEGDDVGGGRREADPAPPGCVVEPLRDDQEQEVAQGEPGQGLAVPVAGKLAREPGREVEVLGEEEPTHRDAPGLMRIEQRLQAGGGVRAEGERALGRKDRVVTAQGLGAPEHPPEEDEGREPEAGSEQKSPAHGYSRRSASMGWSCAACQAG